jgi:CRP/FNR family transcriptional regulator, anaerobic regulatory protein
MSWDRASLSTEVARSLFRDEWDDFERGRSRPFFRGSVTREAERPSGLPLDELSRRPKRGGDGNDGQTWAPATAAAPSTNAYRLLPRYRKGDRKIAAGRDLFSIGETNTAIFNLLSGWVAIYTLLEDGRRQIVHFALPGAVMGMPTSKGAQVSYSAQALTEVVVSVIPSTVLSAASRDDPEMSMRLASALARDTSMAYDHMTSIGRRTARERVAHLLLELFTRYRAQWPGDRIEEMAIPLTQEQIGDATGLTFVHVNRVLATLRKEKIVHFHYRRLRILDPDRLIEVAGVDPQTAMSWFQRRSV